MVLIFFSGRGSVKRTLGSKAWTQATGPFIEIENDLLPLPLAIAIPGISVRVTRSMR
jgi:hypothetical protein